MTQSLIGALRVTLGLDTAQWEDGLTKAQMRVNAAFASVEKATAALGVAAAAGLGLFAAEVLKTTNALGDLADTAQKVGMSAENLARLKHAAELSGVGAETLQASLTRLNRAIAEADTATSGAGATLRAFGITSKTDALDALKVLAAQFEAMPDGAQKAALAVELFGRSGVEMIPLLNSGAEGLAAMTAEADRLGIVIDSKTAAAAEQFGDDLMRLQRVQEGITIQMTAGMVPALSAVTKELTRGLAAGAGWQGVGAQIANVALNIAEAAFGAYEAVSGLVGAFLALNEAATLIAKGDFAKAAEVIQSQEYETKRRVEARRAAFNRIRADIKWFRPTPASAAPAVPEIGDGATGASRDTGPGRDSSGASASTAMGPTLSREMRRALAQPIGGAVRGLTEVGVEVQDLTTDFDRMSERLGDGLSDALAAGIGGADDMKDAFKSMWQGLVQDLMDQFVTRPLQEAVGGILGDALKGLFAGGFADGGLIPRGQWGVVGEEGPELAIAGASGMRVFSNRQSAEMLGGSGPGGVTVNVNGVSDPATVRTYARLGAMEALGAVAQGMRQRRPKLPGGKG